jgi:ABC-type transport system substrate-binding protein
VSRRRLATVMVAALALVPGLVACNPDHQAASGAAHGMIANLNGGAFTSNPNPQRIFNPYLPSTTLTTTYTFEPLFVVNGYDCKPTPWLGTRYRWADPTHLTVTTRHGVTWSDGKAFSASDVAFTFNLLHKVPAFDTTGVWSALSSVRATGPDTVEFTFAAPSAEMFTKIAAVVIVPQHIWAKVSDPAKFTNPKGVGTGPFMLKSFNGQQLILKRNPRYWQANKVKVEQLTFSSNGGGGDTDKLRLAQGAYDWNQMFVADIDKTYVSRDSDHNKYWFPPGADISLYLNLTKAPFSDVRFRRALAYAINRNEISKKAEYGYVRPASQTGLVLPGQQGWLSSKYSGGAVHPYDPGKARTLFRQAGYKYSGGKLLDRSGAPMNFTFKVEAGYLDWIQAANIVKSNLAAVGIGIDVRTSAPTDEENDRAIGNYEMTFGVHGGQCNMYQNFDDPLGSDRTAPIGKPAAANFVRWQDSRTDALLGELKTTTDVGKQKRIVAQLEDVMVQQLPTIPLWYGAIWFEYRTVSAVGWPSASRPYASPNDGLLIITHLTPPAG